MKNKKRLLCSVLAATLGLPLGIGSIANVQAAASAPAATSPASGTSVAARSQSQAQAQPETEKQRKEAEQQAQQTIDKDAVTAIEETQKAVKAIADGKNDEAISAIERATGKIAILIARKPATALVPVDVGVEIIDSAPRDANAVKEIVKSAEKALEDKDYPQARVLLQGLSSEIRVRTYHLPLATYPLAMQEAARLVDQKKTKEASAVLTTALNTLVVIDRGVPLPLTVAQAAINDAQAKRDKDKAEAQKLLATAKDELERAKLLGYAGNDPEYASLNQAIADLEKQLQGSGNTTSTFSKLKEKMDAFFNKVSEAVKKSEPAKT
jgi:hypothetical protein